MPSSIAFTLHEKIRKIAFRVWPFTMSDFRSTVSKNRFLAVSPLPTKEFQDIVYKLSEWEEDPASPWSPMGIALCQLASVKVGWRWMKRLSRNPDQNSAHAPRGPHIVATQSFLRC